MAQMNDSGYRAFPVTTAAAAIAQYSRVTWSGSTLAAAGSGAAGIGVLQEAIAVGDAEPRTVALWGKPGTQKLIANGAISAGAAIFAAASGKVGAAGTIGLGRAIEAASGDGSVIECHVLNNAD